MPINRGSSSEVSLDKNKAAMEVKPEEVGKLPPSPPPKKKKRSDDNLKKYLLIFCVVGVVAVAFLVFRAYSKGDLSSTKSASATQPSGGASPSASSEGSDSARPWLSAGKGADAAQSSPEASSVPSDASSTVSTPPAASSQPLDGSDPQLPGIKDISKDTVKVNNTKVSPDTFVKDLKSLPVNSNYEIMGINTVTDFVTYKKKRSVTDDGIELYWLDATYKGKKAKIQVPFSIFKELDDVGVTVVDVEVVTARDSKGNDHDIVTDFTVRTDFKEILENAQQQ